MPDVERRPTATTVLRYGQRIPTVFFCRFALWPFRPLRD